MFAFLALGLTEIALQWFLAQLGIGVSNSGVSFGLFKNIPLSFLVFAFGVTFWIIRKNLGVGEKLTLVGALTNLVSRLILGGEVWDYLHLPGTELWFNGADVLIVIGTIKIVRSHGKHTNNF